MTIVQHPYKKVAEPREPYPKIQFRYIGYFDQKNAEYQGGLEAISHLRRDMLDVDYL